MGLQSFSVAVDEGLTERLVLRYGLQDAPVLRHVADGPLTKTGAAESEDVAARRKVWGKTNKTRGKGKLKEMIVYCGKHM